MKFVLAIITLFIGCFLVISHAELTAKGKNVCSREEPYSYLKPTTFYKEVNEPFETCCKRVIFCVKKCYKFRVRTVPYTKLVPAAKLKTVYYCCPGWEKTGSNADSCLKAICEQKCRFGACVEPNTCQYNPTKVDFRKEINKEKCGNHQTLSKENNKIDISMFKNHSNPLLELELCKWNIKIGGTGKQEVRISFGYFNMTGGVNCAESMITLRSHDQHQFFYCSAIAPTSDYSLEVEGGEEVIFEVIRGNWMEWNGFEIQFAKVNAPN